MEVTDHLVLAVLSAPADRMVHLDRTEERASVYERGDLMDHRAEAAVRIVRMVAAVDLMDQMAAAADF